MQVLFLNNSGGGFADYVDIPDHMSVAAFLAMKMPGQDPASFLIRVNRMPVPGSHILQADDRITATPLKIEGATDRLRESFLYT